MGYRFSSAMKMPAGGGGEGFSCVTAANPAQTSASSACGGVRLTKRTSPVFPNAVLARTCRIQLYRLTVGGVPIGLCPLFLARF
jgi:hypothetical protein